MNKTLWREVAISTASELYKTDEKLITCHRKEADNDFLTAFIGELKDKVQVGIIGPPIFTFYRLKIESFLPRLAKNLAAFQLLGQVMFWIKSPRKYWAF